MPELGRTPLVEVGSLSEADFGSPAGLAAWLAGACVLSGVPPKDLLVVSGLEGEQDPAGTLRCYAALGLGRHALDFCLGSRAANPGLRVVAFARASDAARLLGPARLGLDATCVLLNEEARPDVPALALSAGAGFVARVRAGAADEDGRGVLIRAIQHKGFSVVDCVGGAAGDALSAAHDASDRRAALAAAAEAPARWRLGVLYEGREVPWEEREPALVLRGGGALTPAGLTEEEKTALWESFR